MLTSWVEWRHDAGPSCAIFYILSRIVAGRVSKVIFQLYFCSEQEQTISELRRKMNETSLLLNSTQEQLHSTEQTIVQLRDAAAVEREKLVQAETEVKVRQLGLVVVVWLSNHSKSSANLCGGRQSSLLSPQAAT